MRHTCKTSVVYMFVYFVCAYACTLYKELYVECLTVIMCNVGESMACHVVFCVNDC